MIISPARDGTETVDLITWIRSNQTPMELTKEYFDQQLKTLATKDDLKPLAMKEDAGLRFFCDCALESQVSLKVS